MKQSTRRELRLEFDVGAERAVGRLRLVGAVIVFAMGLALVWNGAGSIGWVIVVTSWLIGLGWVGAFAVSRRRAADADKHYLTLDDEGLTMSRGKEPVAITWGDVAGIEVDEERLVVWVDQRDGERLRIDPVWRYGAAHEGGLSLDELADTIRDCQTRSRT